MADPDYDITTIEQLAALYGSPSALALSKEAPQLNPTYRAWLEKAPFCVLATEAEGGLDISPRGDPAGTGFAILDDKTLAIPDRRGNNRLDSLKNLLLNPRVGLMFMIPGVTETLRIRGKALLTTDPALIDRFDMDGKTPRTVILIDINAVYFQCARAIIRSDLWTAQPPQGGTVPSAGEMAKSTEPSFDAEAFDADLKARPKSSLY